MSYDLSDYVEVKDRLVEFYAKHPHGSIASEYEFRVVNGKDLIIVTARAYRDLDDPHPAIGLAAEIIPGSTSFTRGAEMENAQTSAWGRALGALGIGVKGAIASAEEVHKAKARQAQAQAPAYTGEAPKKIERVSHSDQAIKDDPWQTQGDNAPVAVAEALLGAEIVTERPRNHPEPASAAQIKFVRTLAEEWGPERGMEPLDLLNAWLGYANYGSISDFDQIGWRAAKPFIDSAKARNRGGEGGF